MIRKMTSQPWIKVSRETAVVLSSGITWNYIFGVLWNSTFFCKISWLRTIPGGITYFGPQKYAKLSVISLASIDLVITFIGTYITVTPCQSIHSVSTHSSLSLGSLTISAQFESFRISFSSQKLLKRMSSPSVVVSICRCSVLKIIWSRKISMLSIRFPYCTGPELVVFWSEQDLYKLMLRKAWVTFLATNNLLICCPQLVDAIQEKYIHSARLSIVFSQIRYVTW